MTALHVGAGTGFPNELVVVAVTAVALTYAGAVRSLRRRGVSWPLPRSLAAATGLLALAVALRPVGDHGEHVVGHLLLTGVAPLLLALSAPVTLALRTLSAPGRRRLLAVLHSTPVRWLCSPVPVVVLSTGGLYLLYLTPWYARARLDPLLHAVTDLHLLAAACLLTWYLVGVDPVPGSRRLLPRWLVLLTVAAAHDVLAKLLYAWALPVGAGTADQARAGAQVMFAGGTVVELLLAVVLLTQWYLRSGRELRRHRRRAVAAARVPSSRTASAGSAVVVAGGPGEGS